MAGYFISLDGLDGTGKSTQCRLLADWLHGRGHRVVECRDPGGTPLGDQLRALVLGKQFDMSLACETFLFMASRAELVRQVIRPALDAHAVIVCDRFLLATIVYQGHAGGLKTEEIRLMGRIATEGLEPDLTIVLDLPVDLALQRRGRAADRMEDRDRSFHEKVRAGFVAEALQQPARLQIVDASASVDQIQLAIRQIVAAKLSRSHGP